MMVEVAVAHATKAKSCVLKKADIRQILRIIYVNGWKKI
jgi:hypothetical protein